MTHLTQEEAERLAGIMGWPWNTADGTYDHTEGGSACLFSLHALKTESPGAHTLSEEWHVTAEGMCQMMVRFSVGLAPKLRSGGWSSGYCADPPDGEISWHDHADPRIAVARAVLSRSPE